MISLINFNIEPPKMHAVKNAKPFIYKAISNRTTDITGPLYLHSTRKNAIKF